MTSLGRHDNVIQLIGCSCSDDGERANSRIEHLTPTHSIL